MPNTSAFPANPALAYPHFNTYRLAPQALQTTSFPLPLDHHAGFPSLEAGRVIGWKEAKARAVFEALKCGRKPDEVVFVDGEGKVVSVEFQQQAEGISPTYTTLASLALPISTASAVNSAQTPEYPSVLAVRGTEWLLASAGYGQMCVIRSSGSNIQGRDQSEKRGAVVAEYVIAWPRSAGVGTGSVAEGEMEQDQEEQGEEYPFLLQAVAPVYDASAESTSAEAIGCHCVISRTLRIEAPAPTPTSSTGPHAGAAVAKKHDVQFQLAGVFIPFPPSHDTIVSSHPAPTTTNGKLGVEWCAQAGEAASYVRWVPSDASGREGVGIGNGRWLIGGSERFRSFPMAASSSSSAMENVHGQQLHDAQVAGEDRSIKLREEARAAEYPYSWTQTKDSVTVTFELAFRPSSMPTTTATTAFDPNRDMILHLTSNSLDLRFPLRPGGNDVHFTRSQRMFFGVLEAQEGRRDWWDSINKEGSTWLFEWVSREEGRGRVVIELVKRNEGVKWASVFAPLQTNALVGYDDDDDDDERDGMTVEEMDIDVPETMTQEQLDASRAGLEQWHATVAEINNSNDGLNRYAGLGSQQMSSLMREQIEDEDLVEFDDDPAFSGHVGGEPGSSGGGSGGATGAGEQGKVGTSMVFTSVSPARGERSGWTIVAPAAMDEQPVWVLSTEITNDAGPSVILKSHVDGQLFVPPRSLGGSWTHLSTNPALSFVLASKRDTQYVHHLHPSTVMTDSDDPGATVIAFEARQPNGMGGNAYVYWPVSVDGPGNKTKSGKNAATEGRQSVVKFGEAGAGPLLGISSVVIAGQIVVVGLCERQLVVLQGL